MPLSRDSEAFAILYSRYSRAVYSLVQRVLRDHHAADDVSQEAFAAVWRAARGYRRERGTASAWLFAIARNAAVDAARARVPLVVGEAPDVPDHGPLPEAMAIAEMEAFEVHVAGRLAARPRARGHRAGVLLGAVPDARSPSA